MLVEWSLKIKGRSRFEVKRPGKEDHSHFQRIKLNNFTASLWDTRKEVLYPISIAVEAVMLSLAQKIQYFIWAVLLMSSTILFSTNSWLITYFEGAQKDNPPRVGQVCKNLHLNNCLESIVVLISPEGKIIYWQGWSVLDNG